MPSQGAEKLWSRRFARCRRRGKRAAHGNKAGAALRSSGPSDRRLVRGSGARATRAAARIIDPAVVARSELPLEPELGPALQLRWGGRRQSVNHRAEARPKSAAKCRLRHHRAFLAASLSMSATCLVRSRIPQLLQEARDFRRSNGGLFPLAAFTVASNTLRDGIANRDRGKHRDCCCNINVVAS